MSGYRFCRSDDVPLLVRAYNDCYRCHFPELPPLTVDGFKQAARELNLWTSSCMVAYDGDEPIAVLLAAKRERENWIHSLGVRPDQRRKEHGRHMLESLARKMAILGPKRILAEVPARWTEARRFVEACGYTHEVTYTDWTLDPRPDRPVAGEIVVPVTIDEVAAAGLFDRAAPRAWSRAPMTLVNRQEQLRGWAVAGDQRIEAWLLAREPRDAEREIAACGAADGGRSGALLGLLVDHYARSGDHRVRIERVRPDEPCAEQLEGWGFRKGAETIGYALEA